MSVVIVLMAALTKIIAHTSYAEVRSFMIGLWAPRMRSHRLTRKSSVSGQAAAPGRSPGGLWYVVGDVGNGGWVTRRRVRLWR